MPNCFIAVLIMSLLFATAAASIAVWHKCKLRRAGVRPMGIVRHLYTHGLQKPGACDDDAQR